MAQDLTKTMLPSPLLRLNLGNYPPIQEIDYP